MHILKIIWSYWSVWRAIISILKNSFSKPYYLERVRDIIFLVVI